MSLLAWPPNDQTSETLHLDELTVGDSHFIHFIRWQRLFIIFTVHYSSDDNGPQWAPNTAS